MKKGVKMLKKAKQEFQFHTSSDLVRLTGEKASNLKELLEGLGKVSGASIFHHTHHAFREHHFTDGLYFNDFAYWVRNSLNEDSLSERLASIDIYEHLGMRSLRQEMIRMISGHLAQKRRLQNAPAGEEFHFCDSMSIIIATGRIVRTLEEFEQALKDISSRSLYYHFFPARIRLKKKTNDFSAWIEDSLDNPKLARRINEIDLYINTIREIRKKIISLVEEELNAHS